MQRAAARELTDAPHTAALLAAAVARTRSRRAPPTSPSAPARPDGFLYLIAVRKSPTKTGKVRFSGLPAGCGQASVLAHPGGNPTRSVTVSGGAFTDPSAFAPHNARVYRFKVS